MKCVIITVLSLAALVVLGGLAFIYSGIYNVAATDHHSPPIYWALETARMRSIESHAAEIVVPAGFGDQAKVAMAVRHFSAHCAVCHGGPGVDRGDFAAGMYPQPPDLTNVSKQYTPGRIVLDFEKRDQNERDAVNG